MAQVLVAQMLYLANADSTQEQERETTFAYFFQASQHVPNICEVSQVSKPNSRARRTSLCISTPREGRSRPVWQLAGQVIGLFTLFVVGAVNLSSPEDLRVLTSKYSVVEAAPQYVAPQERVSAGKGELCVRTSGMLPWKLVSS